MKKNILEPYFRPPCRKTSRKELLNEYSEFLHNIEFINDVSKIFLRISPALIELILHLLMDLMNMKMPKLNSILLINIISKMM